MQLSSGAIEKQDALRILSFLVNKTTGTAMNKMFEEILVEDPTLGDVQFFRELQDGAAHRDPNHVHLRRTTDRDNELYKAGLKVTLDSFKRNGSLADSQEADLISQTYFPKFIAFIDAEYYDKSTDRTKVHMMAHLLMHYDPIEKKPRKHNVSCFSADVLFFPDEIVITKDGPLIAIDGEVPDDEEETQEAIKIMVKGDTSHSVTPSSAQAPTEETSNKSMGDKMGKSTGPEDNEI